jgi:hypothetical protein
MAQRTGLQGGPDRCRGLTSMGKASRHYCRNLHCRTKLPEPVENEHKAFCCRSCFESFYRKRCLVCEKPKHHQRRQLCGHIDCKREKNRFPHLFEWSATTLADPVENASETLISSGSIRPISWLPGCLRAFAWHESDVDTLTLLHRQPDGSNRTAAVVRRAGDGDRWWLARPRIIPEPPIEPLDEVKHRAVSITLCALPKRSMFLTSRKRRME